MKRKTVFLILVNIFIIFLILIYFSNEDEERLLKIFSEGMNSYIELTEKCGISPDEIKKIEVTNGKFSITLNDGSLYKYHFKKNLLFIEEYQTILIPANLDKPFIQYNIDRLIDFGMNAEIPWDRLHNQFEVAWEHGTFTENYSNYQVNFKKGDKFIKVLIYKKEEI